MSRLSPGQLTEQDVSELTKGKLCDGGGLWLIADGGHRLWELRYTSPVTGKRRQMSLGSAHLFHLNDARTKAVTYRRMLENGIDPIDERRKQNNTLTSRLPSRAEIASAATVFLRCDPETLHQLADSLWPDKNSLNALSKIASHGKGCRDPLHEQTVPVRGKRERRR